MRHRLAGKKLGRNTNERKALFRNLIRSLLTAERMTTTLAKAKAIQPQVDKLFVLAKTGTLAARRRVVAKLTDRACVEKLFNDLAKRAKNRTSGFTSLKRVGRRLGDNSLRVMIELVDKKTVQVKKND